MKTPNTFVIYFHLLFSKGKHWQIFTEQMSPFLIPIGNRTFFSLVFLLFCAELLVTVLFLFQKAATNNTLMSK